MPPKPQGRGRSTGTRPQRLARTPPCNVPRWKYSGRQLFALKRPRQRDLSYPPPPPPPAPKNLLPAAEQPPGAPRALWPCPVWPATLQKNKTLTSEENDLGSKRSASKPHGNLQIKRTCVAFHNALRFPESSRPQLHPLGHTKSCRERSPALDLPEAVHEREHQRASRPRRALRPRHPARRPHEATPGVDTGPGPRRGGGGGGPAARRVLRAPGRCRSAWKPTASQMKEGSATGQAARRPI